MACFLVWFVGFVCLFCCLFAFPLGFNVAQMYLLILYLESEIHVQREVLSARCCPSPHNLLRSFVLVQVFKQKVLVLCPHL